MVVSSSNASFVAIEVRMGLFACRAVEFFLNSKTSQKINLAALSFEYDGKSTRPDISSVLRCCMRDAETSSRKSKIEE